MALSFCIEVQSACNPPARVPFGGFSERTVLQCTCNTGALFDADGFSVLPRRWVVERTYAWLLNFRRHSKDYERLPRNSEALIRVAMMHLLLKRLDTFWEI